MPTPSAMEVPTRPAGAPIAGSLAPGPVADRLAEAMAAIPDHPDRMDALATEAEALAEADGDALGAALARGVRGYARYLVSDHEGARDLLTRALAELEPLGDLPGRSLTLGALASVHVSLGHYDEALALALENLRAARAIGDVEQEAWVLATMGNTYVELGQPGQAIENGEQALRLFADLDHPGGQARAHTVLGGALRDLGRFDEALAHHESALRLAREEGARLTEARALDDLGRLAHARGDLDVALDFHRRALALRRALANRQAQASSLIRIGEVQTALGDLGAARGALAEALEIAEATGAEPRVAEAHRALADAYEAGGDPARALHHFRAYHAVREALLSAQARSRLQTLEVRAEADRASQEAAMARVRSEELGAMNRELSRTLRDLQSTQRQLVQAEKLASLGRLSAGLAHEIQNPLNFVANFSELNADLADDLLGVVHAARDGAGPPDLEAVEADLRAIVDNSCRVRDHARRAEGIVRSLMGHVRDVGGERRPSDLHELLERAVSTQVPAGSGIAVVREYDDGVGLVDVAPASIQRVFANLLENAVHALARRAEAEGDGYTPTLTITTEAYKGGVQVRVTDNGVGIPADHCARLFEPFFTTKPTGQGTGLGLSLAYDIVTEGHGGTLAVYSREGDGATFTVTLPVV